MSSIRSSGASDFWLRAARRVSRGRPRVAAGLIGAVGLGIGLALTRSELDRRSARASSKRSEFAPRGDETVATRLQRIAIEQLDIAIDSLSDPSGSAQAVHETRKAIKRLRALLRLLAGELGRKRSKRENAALRDCARRLASVRDSEIVVSSLDAMVDRHPRRLAGEKSIVRFRAKLIAERELAHREARLSGGTREEVLEQLRMIRGRVQSWRMHERDFELIESDATAIYRRGRRAFRVARKSRETAAMHDWRKRVKDLRYTAEMLTPKQPRHTGERKRMERLARRSARLAELLGEEHDLALLAERVRKQRKLFAKSKRTRKILLGKIERRRDYLRAAALELGEQLYGQPAGEFARTIRRAQRGA
jgi:CHAD domain-containing protein